MSNEVTWAVEYDADADKGMIVGGTLEGEVLVSTELQFQHGPIGENGVNGIQNEPLLELLATRIEALDERFPCDENKTAISRINQALDVLNQRTQRRREQGVEGKNEAHTS